MEIENEKVYGKVIDELLRGRDLANKLRQIFNESGGEIESTSTPFAEDLVKEVLMTFTNSILFLNNDSEVSEDAQLTKSEDSLESNCKSSSVVKERRGCYKRRKVSQTWEKESEFPLEDGHQWRKYGQKKILHNDFPRNYYRCTHKYEQGCKATKQVQRIQEDPPLHKTTYYGHHTCKILQNNEIIVDSLSPSHQSSMFLSFDNSFPTPTKQECPFLSSSSTSTSSSMKKEECNEEKIVDPLPLPPPLSSSNNDYFSQLTFDDSDKHCSLSSTLDSHDLGVTMHDILYDDVMNWPLP